MLQQETAKYVTEKHESMTESIETVLFITKTLAPARPAPTDRGPKIRKRVSSVGK